MFYLCAGLDQLVGSALDLLVGLADAEADGFHAQVALSSFSTEGL
jgi:hypothetical protein